MTHWKTVVAPAQRPNNYIIKKCKIFKLERPYFKVGKRAFDILILLIIAPVLLPLIAVLWCLVRLDGGPGMFVQERVGRNGKIYRCIKLRTMVIDAEKVLADICANDPKAAYEWQLNQKLKVDPRITKLGRYLRATSLDELPQIFNVICGDMSFVGPRPFLPSQKLAYDRAGGNAYYHIRPGITGLWQVHGRGQTSFVTRVLFDEDYAKRLSLWTDLVLLLKTAFVVLRKTGA